MPGKRRTVHELAQRDATNALDRYIPARRVRGFYKPPARDPGRVWTAEEVAAENARRAAMREE